MSKEFRDLVRAGEDLQYALKRFMDIYEEVQENTAQSALSVEERSDFVVFYRANRKLEDAYWLLEKVYKPVKAEGHLEKNSIGRYEVEGIQLSSGSYVEFFSDDDEDGGCYVPSRVEHGGEDYYIVALGKEKPIEGLKVRIR